VVFAGAALDCFEGLSEAESRTKEKSRVSRYTGEMGSSETYRDEIRKVCRSRAPSLSQD
jgi:hypothetical protein